VTSLSRRKAYTNPGRWSEEEEALLMAYLMSPENYSGIKLSRLLPGRSRAAIRAKIRKMKIRLDLFGQKYRDKKQEFTRKVAQNVKPKVVYEAYAGAGHQTVIWSEFANEVYAAEWNTTKKEQFLRTVESAGFKVYLEEGKWLHLRKRKKQIHYFAGDAIEGAANMRVQGVEVDLVDLDTCGSTLLTLPLFLVLLKPQHVVITHGEFHSLRFKREDVLRRLLIHRDISTPSFPMTIEQLAKELDKAVKTAALRAHNETKDSFWVELQDELWLGTKEQGMLRRHYQIKKPPATADCLNIISDSDNKPE